MTRFLALRLTANASGLAHGRLDGSTEVARSGCYRASAFSLKRGTQLSYQNVCFWPESAIYGPSLSSFPTKSSARKCVYRFSVCIDLCPLIAATS